MYCYVMEPWLTIRSSNTVTTVTQTEGRWLDLLPYQDLVAWLEVKEVSTGGGTNVQIAYQTAPAKDDSLFVPVIAAFNVALGVTTKIMLKDAATNTLARWLRWQLTVTGSPTSTWDATFRVFIAANVVGRGKATQAVPVAATVAPPAPLAGATSATPSLPLHIDPTGGGTASGTPTPGIANIFRPSPSPPVIFSGPTSGGAPSTGPTSTSNVQSVFRPPPNPIYHQNPGGGFRNNG